jgi:undecaprenyl-diphosphatase
MRSVWRVAETWRTETGLLVSVLVIGALVLAFCWLAGEVMQGGTEAFDRKLLGLFRSTADPTRPVGPPWLVEMARDVTALGSVSVVAILLLAVVGYLLFAGRRRTAWLLLVAVIGGHALGHLLKLGFERARPDIAAQAARVFTASFPSGHATLSVITYLTMGALLTRITPSRRIRVFFMSVALLLTFVIGLSRIYLGVHYPTDVLAGWCVGAAWALACWVVMARLQAEGQVSPPGGETGG